MDDTERYLHWLRAHFSAGGPTLDTVLTALAEGRPAPVSRETGRGVARDLDWLAGDNRFLVRLDDDDYPALLREIDQPPPLLFGIGNRSLLRGVKLAMVGSRRASLESREVARSFAVEFARAGFLIVSGMAQGIDGASHQGALDAGSPTIAVLGHGIDGVYPRFHSRLKEQIAGTGMVLSEFPVGMPPLPGNFPRRNRVVTGFAVGTVVVEAAVRSGSLVSARLAMAQGREVFAIPGPVRAGRHAGCHLLIRDGAHLLECPSDAFVELGSLVDFALQSAPARVAASGKPDELLDLIGTGPVTLAALVDATGRSAADLAGALLELELAGAVSRDAGGYRMA